MLLGRKSAGVTAWIFENQTDLKDSPEPGRQIKTDAPLPWPACYTVDFVTFSLEMVGRLNLPNVCEGEPLDMSCRADRGLDSPDSGLPPSPSSWLLQPPVCADKTRGVSPLSEDEGRGTLVGGATFIR